MNAETPKPDPEEPMAAEARSDGKSQPRNRRWKWIFIAGLVLVLFLIGFMVNRRMNSGYASSSCANHFIQLKLALASLSYEIKPSDPPVILPPGGPDSIPLQEFLGDGYRNGHYQACPESRWRDGSLGYIYIGEGLNLLEVETKQIPILFCPGENHRGSSEHAHCYRGASLTCVDSNAEMLAILQDALKRGEAGEIAYSKKSLETLRREIRKRQD
ncbi:MAG: hypothetical protein RL095_561 [Verrucomicrobiota bacterium]|jgi:hypothetical protein